MSWLLVALGGAVGAPLRYLLDRAVQRRHETLFPWGTFAVNVLGSLVLGAVAALVDAGVGGVADAELRALLGAGLCGALSTYSTFSFETLRLVERGHPGQAAANVAVSVAAGLAAAALGLFATRALL